MNSEILKEIKIGKHSIIPVLLAPMCGITDAPFRKLVKSFGAGLTISEMIASEAMTLKTKNALQKAGVTTVEALNALSDEEINNVGGLGEKTIQEIMDLLGRNQ